MITLVIDDGVIVAIFISLVIVAFMMLFFAYTENINCAIYELNTFFEEYIEED